MEEKKLLTTKFILVPMYDAKISTEYQNIIGTDSLATCIGVLLYSEKKKKAIVAHVAPGQTNIMVKILDLLVENDLIQNDLKYKIIPGYYEEHYNTKEDLEKYFSVFIPFKEEEIPDNAIMINEELTSKRFAFDANTGKFITEKVLFGYEYEEIIELENNSKIRR